MKSIIKTISLGEENTPLIRLTNIERRLNWQGQIWAKAEYQNPTGSFKDRGSVLEINSALKQKKKGIVCASTGNMAASLSAYAAKTNLKCFVVIPKNTPSGKLRQAIICGAKLIKITGDYDDCVYEAKKIAKMEKFLLCGDYELRRIGQQSVGHELANSGILFDAFIVPVGNGTLGCAITKGFAEKNQYPKFIGIQGKGADPISIAWKNNKLIVTIDKPQTIASAIKVGNPLDGNLTLSLISKTDGMIFSVFDKEILKAQKILTRSEGVYVETSAASTLAGLIRIKNKISKLKIVLILTGSGLKEGGEN